MDSPKDKKKTAVEQSKFFRTFDTSRAREVRTEAEKALEELITKYGLILEDSHARFGETHLELKVRLGIASKSEGARMSIDDLTSWHLFAKAESLRPEMVNQWLRSGPDKRGKSIIFRVRGMKPLARKKKVRIETADGSRYVCTANYLRAAIAVEAPDKS